MKYKRNLITSLIASFGLVVLILDTKTALLGARDGIWLCINTIIPSLFPFFVLTSVVNSSFVGKKIKVLTLLGKFLGIPSGSESLMLLGLLGGYPVGARGIENAYRSGCIDEASAKRMLGFCNNAGPAFIFGMLNGLFVNKIAIWALWGIHIVSALCTSFILTKDKNSYCKLASENYMSLSDAVMAGTKSISQVCAWLILFRIFLSFCSKWFLWLLPAELQVLFYGIFELSNGCVALYNLSNQGICFVICSCLLSFGGICVAMQTVSVTKSIGTGYYFPGKIIQTAISFVLSAIIQYFLFDQPQQAAILWYLPVVSLLSIVFVQLKYRKKVVAILK